MGTSAAAREFADLFGDMMTRVKALEMRRNLAHASIDGGVLPVYDNQGNLQMSVGILADGTFGTTHYNPNPPPKPAQPIVTPTWGGLTVAHFGTSADGQPWPLDVARIEVHLSTFDLFFPSPATLVGTLEQVNGGGVYAAMGLEPGTTYYVRLVAVNTSDKVSEPTDVVSAVPDTVVSQAELDQIEQELRDAIDDVIAAADNVYYNNVTAGDGVPVPTGDTGAWFRPDEGYRMMRWDGGAWVDAPWDTEAIAAGAITTAKIEAGAVTADKVVAGAITTEKLSVGSIGDNIILNGNFKDVDAATGRPVGWNVDLLTGAGAAVVDGNNTYLRVTTITSPTGNVFQNTDVGRIPVNPGDQFHVEVGATSTGGTGLYRLIMFSYDSAGSLLTFTESADLTTGDTATAKPSATRGSVVLTVTNATTTHVRFGLRPRTGSLQYLFDRYTVGKVSVSARIADGAVTAEKIKAKAVIADKIDTNAVTATKVAAGAITADKIHLGAKGFAVNDNSSFEQVALDGSGNPIDRPYGWWMVYPTGTPTFTLETASPITGSQSARITMGATGQNARVGTDPANVFPIVPGEKWFVSARVKAVGGNAVVGDGSHLTFHSATSDPAVTPYALFDSRASWQNTTLTEIADGQEVTLTGTFTVPAGMVRGAVAVRLGSRTAAGYYLVDDFVAHPAVENAMVTDITPGKITTGFLAASTRIMAGASEAGARVEMNANGLYAYNSSGAATFVLNGANGSVSMVGSLTSGSSISGASISGTTITGGTITGGSISGATITGSILSTPSDGYSRFSKVYEPGLEINGGWAGSFPLGATDAGLTHLTAGPDSGGWATIVRGYNYLGAYTDMIIYAGGDVYMRKTGSIANAGFHCGLIEATSSLYANTPSVSASANMYVSSGSQVCKISSSRRYKSNITDLPHDVETLLSLRPVEFNGLNALDDPNRRFTGFIAEEAHDLGLSRWVEYDAETGAVESFAYPAWTAALQKIVRHQASQITTLTDQITTLTDRITALENGAAA